MIEKLKFFLNVTGNNLWQFRTRNLSKASAGVTDLTLSTNAGLEISWRIASEAAGDRPGSR